MKSAFRKDVFRQIRTSKRRFVAILLIVALGVAFFSGVRATSPDMRMTLDQYFDDYNAADVQLLSTLGFDEEDLTALREVEGMRIVQPGYAADGFLQRGDTALLVSYQSLDWQSLRDAPDTVINRPVLVEGRYPEAENECLIDAELIGDFQIGDPLTVDVKEDPDMADTLGRLEYTIVGSARSLDYISFQRGSSSKGNGKRNGFVLLPEENFLTEVYTQVYVQAEDTGYSRFSEEYKNAIEAFCGRIDELVRSADGCCR